MVKFEVRFDCGDDERSPAWIVVRYENVGTPNARFGTMVAEFASKDAAETMAALCNRNSTLAKFNVSPSLVA